MKNAKLNFSAKESEVMNNASFILTKLAVINKIVDLMGELSTVYVDLLKKHKGMPQEVFAIHPKISKGEQYRSLPYVMLDYPRIFQKENVLAIRSFFWWANYFSVTLHISGSYIEKLDTKKINTLNENDWYLCVNNDAWQHHFETDNYILLKNIVGEETMHQRSFIKLSRKLPLKEWQHFREFFRESYQQLLSLIT